MTNKGNSRYVFTKMQNVLTVDEIITIFHFSENPTFRFDGESHGFWELMYVERGELILNPNTARERVIKAGEMIIYPPNFFHSHCANKKDPVNIIVTSFTCQSPDLHLVANQILKVDQTQVNFLNTIVSEARNAFSSPLNLFISCELIRRISPAFGAEQLILLTLEALLISVIRDAMPEEEDIQSTIRKMTNDERANKIIDFLHDNIYRKITLEDICEHTSLSPTSIKNIFREATNLTVMKYITNLKMSEAKRLLKKGYTVGQISDMLAFSSVQHFSKKFHTITGVTPTKFVENFRKQQNS